MRSYCLGRCRLKVPGLSHQCAAVLFSRTRSTGPMADDVILRRGYGMVLIKSHRRRVCEFENTGGTLSDGRLVGTSRLCLARDFHFNPGISLITGTLLRLGNRAQPIINQKPTSRMLVFLPNSINRHTVLRQAIVKIVRATLSTARSKTRMF